MGKQKTDYVSLVERCYRVNVRDNVWLADVLDAAAPLLDLGHGCGFSMQQEDNHRTTPALVGHRGMRTDPAVAPAASQIDPASYRALWYPQSPVTFITSLLTRVAPTLRPMMQAYLRAAGVADMIGMVGHPKPGSAFVFWVGLSRRTDVSSGMRDALHRVRLHLESSLRLRLLGAENAVAVLSPTGAVLHTENTDAREGRRLLTEETRKLEHLRTRKGRAGGGESLAAWRALVAGRWSLVEQTDSDGKRQYLAFENPPFAVPYRGLSELEARVVDQSSRGLTGKHVAYALGITESAVCRELATAAARLGFSDRTGLVQFAGHVLRHASLDTTTLPPEVTAAERVVLDLLRRGLTNRAIAELRGTSAHTVAKQVRSLLRKTRSPSRRALLATMSA